MFVWLNYILNLVTCQVFERKNYLLVRVMLFALCYANENIVGKLYWVCGVYSIILGFVGCINWTRWCI